MSTEKKNKTSTNSILEAEIQEVEEELHDVEEEFHEFEAQQTGISRTLQIIVYPSLVAFVVLAAYGFYLVQSLATDVHRLTETIADMNNTVDRNMTNIAGDMHNMMGQMDRMAESTGQMNKSLTRMTTNTDQMTSNLTQMNAATQNMAVSTSHIQHDMWSMNKNVSKPFRAMGKFMPFGGGGAPVYNVPPVSYYGMQNANNWYMAPAQIPAQGVSIRPLLPAVTPAGSGNVQQNTAPASGATAESVEGHSFFNMVPVKKLASN